MAHKRFVDTAERIAASGYGREFATNEKADADLLKSVDLSGACLLSLVRTLNTLIESLTSECMKRRFDDCRKSFIDKMAEWVTEKERLRGPCPEVIKDHLYNNARERIGRWVICGITNLTFTFLDDTPPERGSELRKEWDRWMKRRIKKTPPKPKDPPKPKELWSGMTSDTLNDILDAARKSP